MVKEVKAYRADEERTVLAGLILHTEFLKRIVGSLGAYKKPFRSKWSNLICRWCVEFFQQYDKAPRKGIRHIFRKFAETSRDNESVELIESFLERLSSDFSLKEEPNTEFLVDLASRYFRKVRLENLRDEMEAALEKGDLDFVEQSMADYKRIGFASDDWIDPTNPDVVLDALHVEEEKPLIHFRDPLGTFLSPFFERDGFISFVGPEKRGKSYWLMEVVWLAMMQRRRVLYYVVGDMSRKQVMRRLVTRAIRRPLRAGVIERPISLRKLKDGKVLVETTQHRYEEAVSLKQATKTMKELLVRTGTKNSRIKLKCCGGATLTASDISTDIENFTRQGWIPDVVVVDYADLLSPEPNSRNWDYRHQINESWKVMRRIAQEHHLLFVTATQAAATSYGASVIRKSDFSEDKRKNAHVTGMIGINQTGEEKVQGVYRLNWVFLRDGSWADHQVVYTAGCLGLACPCIVSVL